MSTSTDDLRRRNWESVQGELSDWRKRTFEALQRNSPCTTRELAVRAGLDLLTIRPRVTELVQMGLAELTGHRGRDGVYRAVNRTEWERRRQRLAAAGAEQLQLL